MRRLTLIAATALALAGCTVTIDPGSGGSLASPASPSEPLISSYCRLCEHPLVQHEPGTCRRRMAMGRRCNCPGPMGK